MTRVPGQGSSSWSALGPEHYTDERVLAVERERIFSAAWQPIGLLEQLQHDRDFISAEVAGHGVVVQNFRGSLRAFGNVCSHRQSPLRTCARGNGPLQCPYHGWTYDEAGQVTGIPQRRSFGDMSSELLQTLRLDAWAVEVLGPLVFVARNPVQPSLRVALGGLEQELTKVLTSAHRCLAQGSLELACNWKVMLENGLDAYHVPLVHPNTIHKHGLTELAREAHGDHSVGRFVAASGARVLRALRYAYPGAEISDQYRHFLLFPNVYVVCVYDLFVVVSRSDPRASDATQFEHYVFVCWDGEQGNAALREELNASNAAFFAHGYDEDRAICEQVQRALRHTSKRALFSADEERIPMFHRAWLHHTAQAPALNSQPRDAT